MNTLDRSQQPLFPQSSFVNTTKEKGETLRKYQMKADSQDHLILQFLKHHPHTSFTPSEINKRFDYMNWDINGVRRTLTTWTMGYKGREKLLVMTQEKRIGPKGRPEFCWKYKTNH